MKNDITVKQSDLVTTIDDLGLSDVIKPLVNEIHLFDTYIAGTSFLEDTTVLDTLNLNDKLTLKREDNKYDEKAILILNSTNNKLGYIPEKDNQIFSRLMDAGKLLIAKVYKIDKYYDFTKVSIGIYLVDY